MVLREQGKIGGPGGESPWNRNTRPPKRWYKKKKLPKDPPRPVEEWGGDKRTIAVSTERVGFKADAGFTDSNVTRGGDHRDEKKDQTRKTEK